MTRKQYESKVRQLQRNMAKEAKANGSKVSTKADRVGTPHWGTEILVGSYKGEKLRSYAQAWDILKECLGKTSLFEGIEQ